MNATRFGLALPMYGNELNAGQLMAELTEETLAAESAGLDVVLVPEHHSGPPQTLSDPITIATWLLARTSAIKVGTGVLLLPLHSEVQLAEQASLLQHLSGGRFILGVGAGYQPADFDLFGEDYGSRGRVLEERLNKLRRLFRDPDEASMLRPQLAPHGPPPIWIGAWSNAGVRRASAMSDGWIADPARSLTEIAEMASSYRARADQLARPTHTVVMRETWVGENDDEARAIYFPLVSPIFNYYLKNGAISEPGDTVNLDQLIGERALVGDSTRVVAGVVDLVRRTRADTVVFGIRHPAGPSHVQVLDCIRRLGEAVVPQAREIIARNEPESGE